MMSADNWAYCPQCKINNENEALAKFAKAAEAYGKVEPDEYMRVLDEARTFKPEEENTFREDYDLGVTDSGEFYISYRGGCEVCGLRHEFKHSEQLKLNPKGKPKKKK
jgi:hypothetical protein